MINFKYIRIEYKIYQSILKIDLKYYFKIDKNILIIHIYIK
jgi:hypothetical protein